MYFALEPVPLMSQIRQGCPLLLLVFKIAREVLVNAKVKKTSTRDNWEEIEEIISVYRRYCLHRKSGRIYRQLELPRYFNQVVENKI